LLAAVVAGFVATGMSAEFTEILTVLIVWLPFLLVREFVRSLAFARFRLVAVLLLDVVASAVQVGILLVLAERNTLNSQTAFAASGIACIVGCGCWCLANRPRLRIDLRSVLPDWLHNWSFSRWTLASQLVGCTTPYLLPWLLAGVRGEAATGVYAACSTLVGAANMFVLGLAHFLSPRAAAAYAAGGVPALKRVLAWIATLYVVVLGAFTVLLAVAGNSLLTLIYGDRFTGAGAVAAVLAATMLANSLGMTAGNGLWALDQPSANFRADVCALVVTLFAAAMLIVPCGACGAALAMLIGTGSGAVVRCLILYRRMQQENV
jgi:O-antigen/teichoic acid export membrane protein